MTYQDAQLISQLLAMVIFGSLLVGVSIYAFRPGNKDKFERAARIPLEPDNNDNIR